MMVPVLPGCWPRHPSTRLALRRTAPPPSTRRPGALRERRRPAHLLPQGDLGLR
ncbi:MAG: hypothetical protein R3F43_00775 [bacterium]